MTVYVERSEDGRTRIEEKHQELRQRLQRGEITRQEAESEFAELQSQLNAELKESATSEAQALGITVKDSKSVDGNPPMLLVSGQSKPLIEYTQLDIIGGISSADRYSEPTPESQD